jgi:nocturnin
MQWNMLARALCSQDADSKAPSGTYDWPAYRVWRTLEELVRHNADIICMEEADAYEDLKPYMHKFGYTSVFCPKFASPCLNMTPNWGPDGCVIFYKLAKFQIINMSCEKICTDGEVHAQTFMIMHLKHRPTGQPLTVVCLHLKSKVANQERRTQQTGEILKSIMQHLHGINKDIASHSLVICGDFNGEPFERFHELLLAGVNELGLRDAYTHPGRPKEPTTIKYRSGTLLRRGIDYVFFAERNLKLTGYLELPPVNDLLINEHGLPNLAFSSDHLSLVCDFRFTNFSSQ